MKKIKFSLLRSDRRRPITRYSFLSLLFHNTASTDPHYVGLLRSIPTDKIVYHYRIKKKESDKGERRFSGARKNAPGHDASLS